MTFSALNLGSHNNMKIKHNLFLVIFIFAVACSKDESLLFQTDDNGVIISQSYLWKFSLHGSNVFQSNGHFDYTIIYNQNIAIPTTDNDGAQYMTMINTNNGEIIWQWNDIFLEPLGDFYISYIYNSDNLLTWQIGSRSYCINLDYGTTHWKFKRDKNFDIRINPYGSNYLTYSYKTNVDGYGEYIAYIGNIQTGELTEFLRPILSASYISPRESIGGINYINEVPLDNNLLLVTYTEPLPEWCVNSFFGLYNCQTQKWIYERKLLVQPLWNTSVLHTPIIYNEKAYANVGNNLVCHDLYTGEQVWRKEFDQDFLFSGFIIEEDKIIANNENLTLYCLNPETGSEIWTGEGAGSSSHMSYLNGIVYFVGGSDSKFHAVDIETGQTVWRLDAEKLEGYDGKFKTNAVYVIPGENGEKGKVIALTHMNAYCFEAYR